MAERLDGDATTDFGAPSIAPAADARPIEMVGLYDEFSARSYPDYVGGTSLQRWHRELLRRTMEAEGFSVYEYEWWHFDFEGWEHYRIGNQTFDALRASD